MLSPNSRAAYAKARQELRALLDGHVKPQTATLPMSALARGNQARDGLNRMLFDLDHRPASPIRRKPPPHKKQRSPPASPRKKKRSPPASPRKKKSPSAPSSSARR